MIKNFLKLFEMTKEKDRLNLFVLLSLLVFLTVLETIGVGIIIPLIAIILDEEMIKSYKMGKLYYEFIQNIEYFTDFKNFREKIIFFSSLILFIFFLFKFFITIFITYFQQLFLFTFHQNISNRLLMIFVNKDLNFHIKKNSSELVSDLIEEINEILSIYSSYLILFTELAILIFVSSLMIYSINLIGILILFFISIFGYLILLITKHQLINLGKQRQVHFSKRFNSAKDILNSIKEIKILGVEKYFINNFNFHNKNLNKTAIPKRIYMTLPRTFLEFIAVLAIILILLFLTFFEQSSVEKIVFIIGIIIAGTVKIFPSVSKIVSSSQTIKFGDVAINKIIGYLNSNKLDSDLSNDDKVEFTKEISLKLNKFIYPETDKVIFDNLNLEIKKGQCIGIFGPSGVGKSTLVDILMGIQKLYGKKNSIKVDEINIKNSLSSWRRKFGYVGQNIFFLNDSIEKNIAFGVQSEDIDHKRIIDSLEKANILEFVNNLPEKTKSILGEKGLNISGGQRQRIGIARAFYNNPEILVFDEATSSLDTKSEKLVFDTIKSYIGTKTMIIISHKIENLFFCDQVIKL